MFGAAVVRKLLRDLIALVFAILVLAPGARATGPLAAPVDHDDHALVSEDAADFDDDGIPLDRDLPCSDCERSESEPEVDDTLTAFSARSELDRLPERHSSGSLPLPDGVCPLPNKKPPEIA